VPVDGRDGGHGIKEYPSEQSIEGVAEIAYALSIAFAGNRREPFEIDPVAEYLFMRGPHDQRIRIGAALDGIQDIHEFTDEVHVEPVLVVVHVRQQHSLRVHTPVTALRHTSTVFDEAAIIIHGPTTESKGNMAPSQGFYTTSILGIIVRIKENSSFKARKTLRKGALLISAKPGGMGFFVLHPKG
jgi:hypothetical protein